MISARESVEPLLHHHAIEALRRAAREIGEIQIHLVGGALRDRLLGRASYDLDVTVSDDARPLARRTAELLGARLVPLGGEEFGALRLVHRDVEIDLWDRRGGSLEKDLARRDLTINSIAFDLLAPADPESSTEAPDEPWVDPFGGLDDIEKRLLRATTDKSFDEDALRILRLARFAAQIADSRIPQETLALARDARERLVEIASERVRQEIDKLMTAPDVATGLEVLDQVGVTPGLWMGRPHFDAGRRSNSDEANDTQSRAESAMGNHANGEATSPEDSAKASEHAFSPDLQARLSRFDEAIGYLQSTRRETVIDHRLGRLAIVFSCFGDGSAGQMLSRFQQVGFCSKRDAESVRKILNFGPIDSEPRGVARRLHDMGPKWPTAISVSTARYSTPVTYLLPILALVERRGDEIFSPPRWITGDEVGRRLGLEPGPRLGTVLDALRNAQIEGEVRTESEALKFLDNYRFDD